MKIITPLLGEKMLQPPKPGEVLFEIVNLTTDSPGKESMGYLNSYDGYDDMCITSFFLSVPEGRPEGYTS